MVYCNELCTNSWLLHEAGFSSLTAECLIVKKVCSKFLRLQCSAIDVRGLPAEKWALEPVEVLVCRSYLIKTGMHRI